MKIEIDKEADAMYIELRKGKFFKNKKVAPDTIIDLDNKGNILGIEVLDVKHRLPLQALSKVIVKQFS